MNMNINIPEISETWLAVAKRHKHENKWRITLIGVSVIVLEFVSARIKSVNGRIRFGVWENMIFEKYIHDITGSG